MDCGISRAVTYKDCSHLIRLIGEFHDSELYKHSCGSLCPTKKPLVAPYQKASLLHTQRGPHGDAMTVTFCFPAYT